jgi:NADH-ubiquinone oxidoreductase chain 4
MILSLLIIPLIGVLLLLPLGNTPEKTLNFWQQKKLSLYSFLNLSPNLTTLHALDYDQLQHKVEKELMKKIALFVSLLNLFISVYMWFQFDYNITNYQFVYEFNTAQVLNFCHFHVGVDGISLYFVLLTTFITPICILSNWTDITVKLKYFLISFLILETLQIAVFVVLDLFLFYIFFESVLIPLFFIVIIWGGSSKKFRAAFLLFLYTLAGSLFMLLAILFIYQNTGSTDFLYLSLTDISVNYQKILWLCFFISFAIKTPLFPFHIWLFRAHAEAPLAGSIILAAVILKLASYGFLRVLIPLFPDACLYFLPLVQTVASLTIVYASLSTLRQIDNKQLVAMSSVAHMGVVVIALFSNNIQGIEGGILLGISHGFVSPALFICVGGILYSRYHTRIIKYFKGIVNRMPLFTTLFFVFILFNTAIPLSLNYLGEFLSLTGVFLQSPFISILGASGIVLSAAYSIWVYTRISYGSYNNPVFNLMGSIKDINRREFYLLLPLLITTVVFGILPNIILDALHVSVSTVLYSII